MDHQNNNSPSYHHYPSSRRPILISELQRGQRAAGQLRNFLTGTANSSSPQDDISAVDLTSIILTCFSSCLSIITACPVPNAKKTHQNHSKRRKTSGQSYSSRVVESPTLTDDGYEWRKYGQKPILNAPHPRHYYRCTYKTEQGCQSTKWVQKVSDEPSIYRTLYEGQHTCKSPLTIRSVASPEVLLLADHSNNSYKFLSFGGSESDHHLIYSTNNNYYNKNNEDDNGYGRLLHSFLFSSSSSSSSSSISPAPASSTSTISLQNQNSNTVPFLTDHDHHQIMKMINRSSSSSTTPVPSDQNNNYNMMMSYSKGTILVQTAQYLRDQDIYYNGRDIELGGAAYSCSASSDNIHSNLDDHTTMMGRQQQQHHHHHHNNNNQLEAICNIFDMDYLSSPN